MNEILTDTEQQLLAQQQELNERIRAAEESLMRDKDICRAPATQGSKA